MVRKNLIKLLPVLKRLQAVLRGGSGSGDWGHTGRPGQVGGSGGGGGAHNLPESHPHYKPKPGGDQLGKLSVSMTDQARKVAQDLLGPDVSDVDLASVAGGVSGKVTIGVVGGKALSIVVEGDGFRAERYINKKCMPPPCVIVLKNEEFKVQQTGKGLGMRVLQEQVKTASKLGIARMECYAAGSATEKGWNGYYTWPRLGYDARLPPKISTKLTGKLKKAKKVSDLMKTQEGRDWWKENGSGLDMQFDLKGGSVSRKVFDNYVTEKAKKSKSLSIDKQTRDDRKIEQPPVLDIEDEKILDAIWDKIGKDG